LAAAKKMRDFFVSRFLFFTPLVAALRSAQKRGEKVVRRAKQ
jgi:hypothetical protein